MEPLGLNFFTPNEKEWMKQNWLPRFCATDGKRLMGSKGGKACKSEGGRSQMQVLIEEMRDAFAQEFPYRPPKVKGQRSRQHQLEHLRLTEEAWGTIGQKFKNWLQKHKPQELKNKPKGQTALSADVVAQNIHYTTSDTELSNARRALRGLLRELEQPWSVLDTVELERRRTTLVSDLDDVIQMFSRSVGVELAVFGVWEDAGSINSLELSSARAKSYLATSECQTARDGFITHVLESVGRNLCVPPSRIAPTVYGDGAQDDRPLLPTRVPVPLQRARQLSMYFSALWQWQGGQNEVPWSLLEEDQTSELFALVDKGRMPPGVDGLRNPLEMDAQESDLWHRHIVQGQNGDLAPEEVFQFAQVRPGQYDRALRVSIHPEARLHYPPESCAYVRAMNDSQREQVAEREDGLPVVTSNETYVSVNETRGAVLRTQLAGDQTGLDLLEVLAHHDAAGPHHMPASDWADKASGCPHLKSDIPSATAVISGFHNEDGYLHRHFFDPSSPEKLKWSLESCLQWVAPDNWMHTASGTLEGGPYGVKWAVLLLVHIRINMLTLEGIAKHTPGIRKPEYYDALRPEFSRREEGIWHLAAQTLGEALVSSVGRLTESLPDRTRSNESGLEGDLEALIVSLDDVCVFSAPAQENEWEAAGVTPVAWEPSSRSQGHGTGRGRRKRSGSGDQAQKKRLRSSGRRKSAQKESSAAEESQSAGSSSERPIEPRRLTRSRTRATLAASAGDSDEDDDDDDTDGSDVYNTEEDELVDEGETD